MDLNTDLILIEDARRAAAALRLAISPVLLEYSTLVRSRGFRLFSFSCGLS